MKSVASKPFSQELAEAGGSDATGGGSDVLILTRSLKPTVRLFGALNGRGLWTLLCRETHRFTKIWLQTIVSPLVMTLLFYAVFSVGMGPVAPAKVGGVPFMQFLLPGLVMMSMAQSAFMDTSASLILSKIQRNIVDTLMAPLSPLELTLGYSLSGVLRGLVVGSCALLVLWPFQPLIAQQPLFVLYFSVMGCLMLSLVGLITGILSDKFDHLSAIQNFVIMPGTFLSGAFFSAQSLPQKWQFLCYSNPFFYMIDGFRYGFTGHADGSLLGGMASLLIVNLALFNVAYWLFASGTRLKS